MQNWTKCECGQGHFTPRGKRGKLYPNCSRECRFAALRRTDAQQLDPAEVAALQQAAADIKAGRIVPLPELQEQPHVDDTRTPGDVQGNSAGA